MTMEASARLKMGQKPNSMKSVTWRSRTRSTKLPMGTSQLHTQA